MSIINQIDLDKKWTIDDIYAKLIQDQKDFGAREKICPQKTAIMVETLKECIEVVKKSHLDRAATATTQPIRSPEDQVQQVLEYMALKGDHARCLNYFSDADSHDYFHLDHNATGNRRMALVVNRAINPNTGCGMQLLRGVIQRIDGIEQYVGDEIRIILPAEGDQLFPEGEEPEKDLEDGLNGLKLE